MEQTVFSTIAFLSLIVVLILLYAIKLVLGFQKKKLESKSKDFTQVGFVVETFHELVSKLKEKERELELLKMHAEERACSIELYNENIFQSVPSGVVSFDQELKITKMNSAAAKILDIKTSEVAGKKHSDIFNRPISDILERNKIVDRADVAYVTKSGCRMWLGLNISPLKDSYNQTIGQILVFTDLTELKAFQSQMELRERLSTLGEMSAGIAHELRNPMAVISGYTKILMKRVDNASIPAVEAIGSEVAVMDRIITDFLSFAKPSEPVLSEVDLHELIRGCVQAVSDRLEGSSIVQRMSNLPVIRADEVLLRQSITNLLQNALEAMPEGGVVTVYGSEGDSLDVSISDAGHGIPDSIRGKIFLPFFTTKERGTGLGLSIVHKIVVSHGGTIQVESGEKGTTFTVRLPKEIIVRDKPLNTP